MKILLLGWKKQSNEKSLYKSFAKPESYCAISDSNKRQQPFQKKNDNYRKKSVFSFFSIITIDFVISGKFKESLHCDSYAICYQVCKPVSHNGIDLLLFTVRGNVVVLILLIWIINVTLVHF